MYGLLEPSSGISLTSSCQQLLCDANGLSITGPSNVCLSGNTFSLPLIVGATYSWHVTGSLGIENPLNPGGPLLTNIDNTGNPNTPNIITVKATGTSGGTIYVTFNSECWSTATPLQVSVSSLEVPAQPEPNLDIVHDMTDLCNISSTIDVPPVPGAVSYTWTTQISGTGVIQGPRSGNNSTVLPHYDVFFPHGNGQKSFSLTLIAHSNCGSATSTETYGYVFYQDPCNPRPAGSPSPFAFYPIPADASLRVELIDTDSATGAWDDDPALTTQLQIVDLYGQSWLTQSAPGRSADLPTGAVPTGLYVLRVQRGTRLETTQISIEH